MAWYLVTHTDKFIFSLHGGLNVSVTLLVDNRFYILLLITGTLFIIQI